MRVIERSKQGIRKVLSRLPIANPKGVSAPQPLRRSPGGGRRRPGSCIGGRSQGPR
jgi:hypothetical protein